jgi:hypothetical protein
MRNFRSKETREEYERQLNCRKLKVDESIETYYWEILRLCEKIDKTMSDDVKVSHLLRGLHPKIAKDIYLKKPKTPTEVYDQLVQFEKFESLMGNHFAISTMELQTPAPDSIANAVINKLQALNINTRTQTRRRIDQPGRGRGFNNNAAQGFRYRDNYDASRQSSFAPRPFMNSNRGRGGGQRNFGRKYYTQQPRYNNFNGNFGRNFNPPRGNFNNSYGRNGNNFNAAAAAPKRDNSYGPSNQSGNRNLGFQNQSAKRFYNVIHQSAQYEGDKKPKKDKKREN